MSTVLVNAIAEALAAHERLHFALEIHPEEFIDDAEAAADAVIAVVAAMPADYTATDVLAALRGEDVPSEPLPAKAVDWDDEGRPLYGTEATA